MTHRKHGSVKRVAEQLDVGVESLRSWVHQAEIDAGDRAGTTTEEAEELKALRQEVKELRRANQILKSASLDSRGQCNRDSNLAAGVSNASLAERRRAAGSNRHCGQIHGSSPCCSHPQRLLGYQARHSPSRPP